ncbi:MAG: DUF5317 family protein [Patescibacteria group bacterium]|nr:DUF5317 family protein [Patescibacteria group bacterium]MDE2015210.1 DUF5317 family protein [Patescibacteria group bacterium]
MPIPERLCIQLLLITFLLITRFMVGKRIKNSGWPKFLGISTQVFHTAILFIFLGGLANLFVMATNHFKMPVLTEECRIIEWDDSHIAATNKTNISFLADDINADRSAPLRFLYPRGDCLSLGDLSTAAGIIFMWWIALVITFWSLIYALRNTRP